jgi:hypothetical protein
LAAERFVFRDACAIKGNHEVAKDTTMRIPGVTPGRGAGGIRSGLKPTTPEEFRENQRVLAWALITSGFLALLAGISLKGRTDWALLAPFSVVLAVGGGVILVRTHSPAD